jgi:hypothetical protein
MLNLTTGTVRQTALVAIAFVSYRFTSSPGHAQVGDPQTSRRTTELQWREPVADLPGEPNQSLGRICLNPATGNMGFSTFAK